MSADRLGTGLDGAAPAVSFVLIFKDEERFIGEAIESVVAQTFTDWELLLVDDGSTDHSTSIAEKWVATDPERIRYLDHEGHRNLGMSASRNRGIAEARGHRHCGERGGGPTDRPAASAVGLSSCPPPAGPWGESSCR